MSVSLVSHGEVVGHWCTRRHVLIHEHLLVPRDGADACERRVLRLCLDHLAVDGNCILQHGLVNAVASCCCSEGHQETMIATICCIVQEAMVIYSFCVNRGETIMHDRQLGVEVRFITPGEPRGTGSKTPGGEGCRLVAVTTVFPSTYNNRLFSDRGPLRSRLSGTRSRARLT